MALRDEIKAGRKDLMEKGTLKQKIAYFFDYYTIHTIVVAAVLIFTISFIYQQVTKPDVVLNGLVLNVLSFEEDDPVEDLSSGFLEYLELDPKKYEVSLNSALKINMSKDSNQIQYGDYESSQAIMAQCSAGIVDFMSSPLYAILDYGYGDLVVNLEEVLSQEELEKYEPYLLYVDEAVIERIQEAYDNMEDTSEIVKPDPTKPEEMEKPIPVFIDVTACEKMADIYNYTSETLAIGVAVNAPNPDRISDFLTYLFEE